MGKNTYVCFLDLRKAFDKVDRALLLSRLNSMGIPKQFTEVINHIYSSIRVSIKNGDKFSEEFTTSTGVPQGCPLSPLMYILFASDMKKWLHHQGIYLEEFNLKFLQYADDIALLADTAKDLELGLKNIAVYLKENKLEANVIKTKVMNFHKGRPKQHNFYFEGDEIENVKSFKYLGFLLSPQLSWTNHLKMMISKARARIGFMFANLPLREIPLDMFLNLFKIYILGLFQFGLPIWRVQCAKSAWDQLDSTFTKYLKSYLGIPKYSNNAITHFLSETIPFSLYMMNRVQESISVLIFPKEYHNIKLSFLDYTADTADDLWNIYEKIPTWYWMTQTFEKLPTNPKYRKRLCQGAYDQNHKELCSLETFHIASCDCKCKFCNELCTHFHERFCTQIN